MYNNGRLPNQIQNIGPIIPNNKNIVILTVDMNGANPAGVATYSWHYQGRASAFSTLNFTSGTANSFKVPTGMKARIVCAAGMIRTSFTSDVAWGINSVDSLAFADGPTMAAASTGYVQMKLGQWNADPAYVPIFFLDQGSTSPYITADKYIWIGHVGGVTFTGRIVFHLTLELSPA